MCAGWVAHSMFILKYKYTTLPGMPGNVATEYTYQSLAGWTLMAAASKYVMAT